MWRQKQAQRLQQRNSASYRLPASHPQTLPDIQLVVKVEHSSLGFVQVPWHVAE